MSTTSAIVRLEGFEKWYGKVHAVKSLYLEVKAGEAFVLLGSNGSGKSTILRAVAGLHAPTSGRVEVDGIEVFREPGKAKRRLAFLPQRVVMPGLLTARELLTFYAGLKKVDLKRVNEALEFVGLVDDADRHTREYSGGMIQRLGLAITFLRRVPLLLLDEPTLNLDPTGIEQFRAWVSRLRKRGVTVFFTSHILQEALRLADRVGVMSEGRLVRVLEVPGFRERVVAATSVRVVVDRASDLFTVAAKQAGAQETEWTDRSFSFKAPPERRQKVIRAIEEAGGLIEELHTEPPNWESLVGILSSR